MAGSVLIVVVEFCGEYWRRIELSHGKRVEIRLKLVRELKN